MITSHSHLVKGARVYGLLNCQFDMHTGEIERWDHLRFRHSFSLSQPARKYHPCFDFANPAFAACVPPDFGPRDLQAAEEWLADTVSRLDSVVEEFGFPGLRRHERGPAKLRSSYGEVAFDAETGRVNWVAGEDELAKDNTPVFIDVCEWRSRYPGEPVAGEHDILDFGYWYLKDGLHAYEPPCEDWRLDRERRILDDRADQVKG